MGGGRERAGNTVPLWIARHNENDDMKKQACKMNENVI